MMNSRLFERYVILFSIFSAILGNHILSAENPNERGLEIELLPHPFDFDGPCYLKSSLTYEGAWPGLSDKMMVYKVKDPNNITEDYVRDIARQYFDIPLDAELTRSGALGYYWLKSLDKTFEYDPSNGSFHYTKNIRENKVNKAWPSQEECERIAHDYLDARKLSEKDSYIRGIRDNTHSGIGGMSVGYGRMIDGYKTWGAGAEIIVDIGPEGEVVKLEKKWQNILPCKPYPIKSPQEALEDLNRNEGVLMSGGEGKVVKITLRYYCSPQKQKYVQPCYYFDCIGRNNEGFHGVVPAIKQEYLKARCPDCRDEEDGDSRRKNR